MSRGGTTAPPGPAYAGLVKRTGLPMDAAVAVLALGATVAVLATGGFGPADPSARAFDATALCLAAASTLPLAARRLSPALAYAVAAVASVALIARGHPLDVPIGAMVAGLAVAETYTAENGRRRVVAGVAVLGFVPALAVAYAARGLQLLDISTELAALMLAQCGVWVAGDRARLRRERVADLEERAHRLRRDAERERRLAAAEERTRIARELHDSAGHAINVIMVQAGAARLLHDRDPERSLQAVTTIEEVARDTVAEIDRMVHALRRDDGDLLPAADLGVLDELLDRCRHLGLHLGAAVRGDHRDLPRTVSRAAYRILQESLVNAARHGRGDATVDLDCAPLGVAITVTNRRRPHDRDRPDGAAGHGITGMRERAELLGGSCVAGAVGDRFRVSAWLPATVGVAEPSDRPPTDARPTGPWPTDPAVRVPSRRAWAAR